MALSSVELARFVTRDGRRTTTLGAGGGTVLRCPWLRTSLRYNGYDARIVHTGSWRDRRAPLSSQPIDAHKPVVNLLRCDELIWKTFEIQIAYLLLHVRPAVGGYLQAADAREAGFHEMKSLHE